MIRGIRILTNKSIQGISLPLNRAQTRSFLNSTPKSFSTIINNNNNSTFNNNKLITKRSYSTENNNNNNIVNNSSDGLNELFVKFPYIKPETFEAGDSTSWFTNFKLENVDFLNQIHEQYGLSWFGIIAGLAISLRLVTFPLTVRTQKIGAKMKEVKAEVDRHSYLNDGTNEGRIKLYQLREEIQKKHGVSTLSAIGPNLLLLPLLIYPFIIIRQVSENTTLLDNTSFLWINSISSIDPFYILPVVSSIIQIASSRVTMTHDTHPIMKGFMYSLGVLPLLFTIHFSAALNFYWVTNSILFLLTNLFFKTNFASKLFNIPQNAPKEESKIVIAPEQFTQVKTIEENKESSAEKNKKLQEAIKSKNELVEQKREQLKAFRRSK